jgi:hypothetical protein
MRVLYAGNGNAKHYGARYYDVGRKIMNGLIRNGCNVYFFSDRDVKRAANILGSGKFGKWQCNRAFLKTCAHFVPDFIILGHADIITPKTLQHARKMLPNVRIAQFNVDPVFRQTNVLKIQSKLPVVDATFITTAGPILKNFACSRGVVSYMPNPIDSSIEWPESHLHSDQPHDVFWALRANNPTYPGNPRIDYPLYLERSGQISIDYYGMNDKPELFGARYYQEISKCRMGLNISVNRTWSDSPPAKPEELYLYASDRISHYMGSGLLTFTPRENRLEELFKEDEEMIFFSSKEELLEKTIYYKKNDQQRRKIAKAGWEKSHQQLNERLVAQYITEVTFQLPLKESYAWPTECY